MSDFTLVYDPRNTRTHLSGGMIFGPSDPTPSIVLGQRTTRYGQIIPFEGSSISYAANLALQHLDHRLSVLERDVETLLTQISTFEVPEVFAIPPINRQTIEVTLVDEGFAPFRYIESEEDV